MEEERTARAQALLDRGTSHNAAGRPRRAAAALRSAVELVAEPATDEEMHILVRALMSLSNAEFEHGGREAGWPVTERAMEWAERSGDPVLLTLCHSQRATMLGRSGDIDGARVMMEQAVARLHALSSLDSSVVLLNYGVILTYSGDLAAATRTLERAKQIADANGHERVAYMSRANQGFAASMAGDLPRALQALQEADASDVDVERPTLRLDIGRILLEAGLITEATEALTGAVEEADRLGQRQALAESEVELARAHVLLGRPQQAKEWARRAERRFSRRSAPIWRGRAQLIRAQAALLHTPVRRATLDMLQRLSGEVVTGDWLLVAEYRLVAAEAAWRCGEWEQVRAHLEAVEPVRLRLPLRAQLQAALVRAELAIHDQMPATARRVLGAASRSLAREQGGSASTDVRAAITMYAAPLARMHLSLASTTSQELFDCTERWRATSRLVAPVQPPQDPELATMLQGLREVRVELRNTPIGPGRDALLARELELRRATRSRAWAWGNGGTGQVGTVDYRRTKERLSQLDVDLLSMFVKDGRMHVLRMGPGRSRVVELGPADALFALAQRIRADLDVAGRHDLGEFRDAVWSSLSAGMAEVDARLLAGAGLGERPVVLVPVTWLSALPWAMAPSLAAVPLVVSASATDWTQRSALEPTVSGRRAEVRALAGPGLELADDEVAEVAAQWAGSGVAVPTEQTDTTALGDALHNADLVHVAAHGSHHQQSPMFASIDLASGPMYVYDMQSRGVNARHVVLSSCEVGRSTTRFGEEAIGLSAGLLGLGAQSVVAGICRVPDDVAASTMSHYHRLLSSGQGSAEAMATAISAADPLAAAFQVAGASWHSPVGS